VLVCFKLLLVAKILEKCHKRNYPTLLQAILLVVMQQIVAVGTRLISSCQAAKLSSFVTFFISATKANQKKYNALKISIFKGYIIWYWLCAILLQVTNF